MSLAPRAPDMPPDRTGLILRQLTASSLPSEPDRIRTFSQAR